MPAARIVELHVADLEPVMSVLEAAARLGNAVEAFLDPVPIPSQQPGVADAMADALAELKRAAGGLLT